MVESQVGDELVLDSGCSFHMNPHKDWFANLSFGKLGSVLLDNDQVCQVEGMGDIKLRIHDGSIKILSDVRYVPDLKRNLISLGVLESKGFNFKSEKGIMNIFKNSRVIMRGFRDHSLYYLDGITVVGASKSNVHDNAFLWHKRLGHVCERCVNELLKQNISKVSKGFKLEGCEQCVLGKVKKQPYGSSSFESKAPLEYVYSDLWGPSRTESLGGGRYFMSIMDDFSRKLWVYILKNKFDAYGKFKEWC